MNLIQAALFKMALKGEITETELRVLNELRQKPQGFLELAENTGAAMLELEEILGEFKKKKIVKETGGKYFIDTMTVLEALITEAESLKEIAALQS